MKDHEGRERELNVFKRQADDVPLLNPNPKIPSTLLPILTHFLRNGFLTLLNSSVCREIIIPNLVFTFSSQFSVV